jgi:hypothetical protein
VIRTPRVKKEKWRVEVQGVIFPPPLSPTNEPEEVEIVGILSKSLEIFLPIGVIYLMRWEKKKLQNLLIKII